MDNENNQLPDINVGNLNFQPMPKRFMVWDKKYEKFLTVPMEIWQIVMHFRNRYFQLYDDNGNSRYIFCQSTNLFDKDDKEIFEGGVIDYDGDGAALGLVVSIDAQWQLKDKYGNLMFLKGAPHQKLVGHILSNPELLKEDNV